MKSFQWIRSAFNLYPEEIKKTGHFGLLAFLWSFGASCSVTLFDGLFLETLGPKKLPEAYAVIALCLISISILLFKGLKVMSLKSLFRCVLIGTILIYAAGILLIRFWPSQNDLWVFALKVFAAVGYAALSITFWSFIDEYYDLQDAKRIYTLVMAAVFTGAIASGSVISFCVEHIGTTGLMICMKIAFITAHFVLVMICKKHAAVHDELEEISSASKNKNGFKEVVKQMIKSPYVFALVAVNMFAQLLWNVTEFNYMSSFTYQFDGKPTYELIEFLGSVKAWISLANVTFMLFLYSRMVRKLGLNNSALVPCGCFLALYAAWQWHASFAMAILGIIAVEGILFTIEDNNFNLLLNITSDKIKRPLRIFIEAFVEPASILIAAGLLSIEVSAIIIGGLLAFLGTLSAFVLKKGYRPAILENLKSKAIRFDKTVEARLGKLSRKEKKRQVEHLLKSETPPEILAELLIHLGSDHDFLKLIDTSAYLNTTALKKVISTLDKASWKNRDLFFKACEKLLEKIPENDSSLKPTLLLLLADARYIEPDEAIKLLEDPNPRIQAAAILALDHAGHSLALDKAYEQRTFALFCLQKLLSSKDPETLSMGLFIQAQMKYESDIKLLLPYLEHKDNRVQIAAARSINALIHKEHAEFAPSILKALGKAASLALRLEIISILEVILDPNPDFISAFAKTTERFGPKEKRAVAIAIQKSDVEEEMLLPLLQDEHKELGPRLILARAYSYKWPKAFRKALKSIVVPEIHRASIYFYSAHVSRNEPLSEALLGSFNRTIDFVIHLLALGGSVEDSDLITHALRSESERVHSHALETIEKTCEAKIFRLLEPLIDDRPIDEKLKRLESRLPDALVEGSKGTLDYLEASSFVSDRLIALHEKVRTKKLKPSKMLQSLRSEDQKNPLFQHFVCEVQSQGNVHESH